MTQEPTAPDLRDQMAMAALTALRLHDAYLAVPQDRGGPNGTKGRAHQAWLDAKAEALSLADAMLAQRARTTEGEGS